jgi:hypothetical protein
MVFVCVSSTAQAGMPAGVSDFCDDLEFKNRVAVVALQTNDTAETELLEQLEIKPNARITTTALLAPPGVLVGKFDPSASKEEIAAALHKAGKCCDDPNCKHNQANQVAPAPKRN